MGTELQKRGVGIPLPIWTADANIDHPDIVIDIHKDYIKAGANIITTNTFRTTSWTYKKTGLTISRSNERAKNSLYKAVECAHNASVGLVKVAGSISSIDDCYQPEKFPGRSFAEDIYGQTLDWVIDAGVDILLFETMGSLTEIDVALSLANKYEIPIWLSIIMKNEIQILDGTHLNQIIHLAKKYAVDCLLTNCNEIEKTLLSIESIVPMWDKKWGVFPNLGIVDYGNEYFEIIDKTNFSIKMKNIFKKKPDVVGGCCGSSPEHIKILSNILKEENHCEIENKSF